MSFCNFWALFSSSTFLSCCVFQPHCVVYSGFEALNHICANRPLVDRQLRRLVLELFESLRVASQSCMPKWLPAYRCFMLTRNGLDIKFSCRQLDMVTYILLYSIYLRQSNDVALLRPSLSSLREINHDFWPPCARSTGRHHLHSLFSFSFSLGLDYSRSCRQNAPLKYPMLHQGHRMP